MTSPAHEPLRKPRRATMNANATAGSPIPNHCSARKRAAYESRDHECVAVHREWVDRIERNSKCGATSTPNRESVLCEDERSNAESHE